MQRLELWLLLKKQSMINIDLYVKGQDELLVFVSSVNKIVRSISHDSFAW